MEIHIKNLVKTFQKNRILNLLSLKINSGVIYGITGPNGSGKSTLLKCIAGLTSIDSGTIKIGGVKVSSGSIETRMRTFLINHEAGMYGSLTGIENLQFLGRLYNKSLNTVCDILESVGLKEHMHKEIKFYSVGMLQKLKLSSLLLLSPKVLLLDEPTSGLDERGLLLFNSLIINWREQEKTLIVVTHDREWLKKHTQKIGYLINGGWSNDA